MRRWKRSRLQAALIWATLFISTGAVDDNCTIEEGKIAAFNKWLERVPLPVNRLKLELIPGYRMGTTATRALAEGEEYITVPESILIGPERVGPGTRMNQTLEQIFKAKIHERDDATRAKRRQAMNRVRQLMTSSYRIPLLLFLMQEVHRDDSQWGPYFALLPGNVTTPLYFPQEDLDLLVGSEIVRASSEYKRRIRREYDLFRAEVFARDRKAFPVKGFTLKRYLWATAMYDSRVIQLSRQAGSPNTPTFIPLIDMVNSKESHDRSFIQFDHARRVAFMKADTAFAAGQQVFESYGNKSNYEYLLYNGFVMPDNPNQCVFVEFPDPERPHGAAASLCVSDTNVPPRVRAWANSYAKNRDKEPRAVLSEILLGKLARYRGTEEDDAARLAAGGLEDSTRLALEFRLHERAALRRVIDALDSGRVNL